MSALIFAGGHRFTQRPVGEPDRFGRHNHFRWLCEVCGVDIDPSEAFIDCAGPKEASDGH